MKIDLKYQKIVENHEKFYQNLIKMEKMCKKFMENQEKMSENWF